MLRIIELEEKVMAFTFNLDNDEINKAMVAHVKTLGIPTEGKHVTVDITSTRKPVGYSAVVTVSDSLNTVSGMTDPVEGKVVNIEPTVETEEEEINLPKVTPETAGHESNPVAETKASLFDE